MLVAHMKKANVTSVSECVHHTGEHGIHYVKTCFNNISNSGGKRFENSTKCPICWGNGLNILKPNSDNFL